MPAFDDMMRNATEMQSMYPMDRPSIQTEDNNNAPATTLDQLRTKSFDELLDMEIASMITDRRKGSEEWRQPKRLKWDKCYQHYQQVYDKSGKEKWQSTTFQPLTSKVVETIMSNLYGAMMGSETPVEYQARRDDFDKTIRSINDIIQSDFEKSKFKVGWSDFLRTLSICGTAIGKIDYVKEKEIVMEKERRRPSMMDGFLSKLGMNVETERFNPIEKLVKDFSRFRNVDLYDIYPQPKTTEITKDTWIIEKGLITNRQLIQGKNDPDPYYRLNNVTDSLLAGSSDTRIHEDPEKATRRIAFLEHSVPMHYLDPDRPHELLEFWGPIPIWYIQPELKNDPSKRYETVPGWIWLVDGQYVVRKQINPFRDGEPPYVKGNYIRLPGEFYGTGPAELIIGLQIEKNELRNCRVDNVNLTLNKVVGVLKDKVHNWKSIKSGPGAIWTFKEIDDIKKAFTEIQFSDITKDSYMASNEVDREAQEVTAATKATIGVGGSMDEAGGGTFRGQLLNKQVSTERFMLYARVLEITGLSEAIKKMYQRIYQFKSFEEMDQILGPQRSESFTLVLPEDLEKIAKLVPLGVMTLENKGVKLAQMRDFTLLWKEEPWFKKIEMARQMYIEGGNSTADKVLFSDQEMEKYNQFKQQLMGQIGGGIPGMPGENPNNGNPGLGLVGPDGRSLGGGGPIAGNMPGPTQGLPRPPMQARGPGSSPIDMSGMPMS